MRHREHAIWHVQERRRGRALPTWACAILNFPAGTWTVYRRRISSMPLEVCAPRWSAAHCRLSVGGPRSSKAGSVGARELRRVKNRWAVGLKVRPELLLVEDRRLAGREPHLVHQSRADWSVLPVNSCRRASRNSSSTSSATASDRSGSVSGRPMVSGTCECAASAAAA